MRRQKHTEIRNATRHHCRLRTEVNLSTQRELARTCAIRHRNHSRIPPPHSTTYNNDDVDGDATAREDLSQEVNCYSNSVSIQLPFEPKPHQVENTIYTQDTKGTHIALRICIKSGIRRSSSMNRNKASSHHLTHLSHRTCIKSLGPVAERTKALHAGYEIVSH